MALIFKPGVRIDTHVEDGIARQAITEEASAAILMVARVFNDILRKDCVVTSVNDSTHPAGDTHYTGNAVDFRLKHLESPALREFIVQVIAKALNSQLPPGVASLYDVVHEGVGTENEHCHVEYQPH